MPNVGHSWPQDQELHALSTGPARHPREKRWLSTCTNPPNFSGRRKLSQGEMRTVGKMMKSTICIVKCTSQFFLPLKGVKSGNFSSKWKIKTRNNTKNWARKARNKQHLGAGTPQVLGEWFTHYGPRPGASAPPGRVSERQTLRPP